MHYIYFGTKERMAWIPCPAIDADLSKAGWSAGGRYLNGGGWVRRSSTAGKVYKFSWNLMSAEELAKITDYADGLYGPGPFYFHEPFAYPNVLPQYWAAPRLAAADAPGLVVDKRPVLVDTPANDYGYPTKRAVYTLLDSDDFAELWLPVPEGFTLHVGAHGTATETAAVSVDGTPLTLLSEATAQLTNHAVVGPTAVTLTLSGTGSLELSGIIAALKPTGEPAPTGNFVSGRGHSGCDFENHPTETGYSAALDKKGATATLIEVGAWR